MPHQQYPQTYQSLDLIHNVSFHKYVQNQLALCNAVSIRMMILLYSVISLKARYLQQLNIVHPVYNAMIGWHLHSTPRHTELEKYYEYHRCAWFYLDYPWQMFFRLQDSKHTQKRNRGVHL